MKRIVILISGRGSNMEAIVGAAQRERWPAAIAAVISNRRDADGLVFAASRGVPTAVVPSSDYASRELFDDALLATIDHYRPDLVVLAGFMRILTNKFVAHYAGRIINIHPSLLPDFPGLATHRRALEAGVPIHGATVHFVTPELDHGPVIAQVRVPVLPGDTEATLGARVLLEEHKLYPTAIRLFVDNRLLVSEDGVHILPSPMPADCFAKDFQ